ncbi:uncharacterized protein LOC119607724 isoform X1 [Lucilia sericata]|uniref:uncharacterized protein LOC119607724 isoform X1 n=1 Tax=Lucilia sericata TaxID=13632 RepID=UPI0018A81DF7|nr:uncharacterized protein LOC119607724 isoform X1 [Lucilia sericata]
MWKIITLFLCIFYTNYVQATYNTGIKTRVYEQQPITHVYHHHQHSQQYTPTHGHYHQYGGSNDKDYQSSITHQYAHNDNSYQQQQREGGYYQQTPTATSQTSQQTQQHRHQQHYQQQQQPQAQPIYERRGNSPVQTTGNWQNSENSVTEYYTGCPSGHTGQLPYAYDCRRFLNCWNGRGHIQTCSVGTVFNPETLECDRPDKVKCEAALGVLGVQSAGKSPAPSHGSLKQPTYRAGRYTDSTNDNVEVLCPAGAEGLQPHPSDCTRFLNCANGNMHIQQCGPGTAYSIAMKVCDFKHKVDCSGREGGGDVAAPTYRQVQNSASNNEITCPSDAAGLYPHPLDCTKFLQCSNGATYIQDCGPGTAFDSARLICDYKHKVKCCSGCTWSETETETSVVVSENHHTQATPPQPNPPTNNQQHEDLPHTADILCPNGITGLFAYPFDYTKFINCKNGNTAIQNCVPGTAFSISKGYCESLEDIQQSDHVIYIVSQVSYEYSQTLITCPPGTEGLHLYPFNAELYVKCVKSQMKIVPCSNSLVFSFTRRTCLPYAQVLKNERVRLLSELQTTSNYHVTEEQYRMSNMVYCPGGLTGSYPHPFDSTKYLKCVRGRLYSESCASGEAFSLSRKVCSLKEELNADDHVPMAKTPQGHEWRITDMEVTYGSIDGLTYLMCPPGLEGYFLNPFDCTKYIQCSQGATVVDECLNGSVFSISRKECIPRDKVEAYDRVEYLTTTKNEFTNESVDQYHHDLGISCNPGTFGIYPHPHDCHKYIRCANGRLSMENCPAGQVFSLTRSFCQNENEVDNKDRSSYNRGHYTGAATTNTVYQPGSYTPINIPHTSLSPPPPPTSNMLPPSAVLSPPLPSPLAPIANDVNCPPGATGRYPHPYDCTKFLMCANGETHIQDCGPGTAWNKAMEVCDFKDKVDCSQSGGTSGYSTSTITTSIYNSQSQFPCPDGVEGAYQHPYDWHKYLVCSHGQSTIMDCAPGTVFSLSRKICDTEANVLNTDRCNNGVYSSDYDYTYTQTHNRGSSTVNNQWTNVATSQTQPTTVVNTQISGNRWTNMNVPRPQGSTTWQHTTNTHHQIPPPKPDVTPVWSGTAVHVDQHNPTHTVIYEEGSFEPNRNYNRQMFNTPLSPLKPTTTTTTASTLVYAQPVDSQEDSQEIFSKTPTQPSNPYNPSFIPTSNRQNHTRYLNSWTPIRPVDLPRHDIMPPPQNTVYTNARVPITTYIIPSNRAPQPSQPSYNIPGRPQTYTPNTHFPSEDSGQKPLPEAVFKTSSINIDQLPGQNTYNLNDFDQLPSASSKHNTNDASNLYGGLQPPAAATVTTTTASSFLDPYPQTTQVPLPPRMPTKRISVYPQLSNATIQTFPHQPHYSHPYSEVTHSRNASWVGRKTPQHSAIKPSYRDPLNSENTNVKITSTPPPQYYGLSPPPYANSEYGDNVDNPENQEVAMKEALKLLLKPYLEAESKVEDTVAEMAQSHIMSLVSTTTTTTTTHKPPTLPSNQNTLVPSTTPHQEDDAELIIAGEQHSLVGVTTTTTGGHETSTSYNLHQSRPLQSERSSLKPHTHNHDHNSNWHKHHSHDTHHFKSQHNREFHEKHPNLPNPFDDTTKPISSYNPRAESTTPRTYGFDLRVGSSRCPFDCGNGKCVEEHQVCDGVNNCGNRKDEQQCEHLGYAIRLTGGQSPNMGRVEVKILGKWGYVCDDKFGLPDADVVCHELGFKMGAMEVRGNSYYSPSDVNVYFAMDEVQCKGNETSLRECDFKGWGVNNCGPDEVVGVVCKVPKLKCPDNYWLCSTSKECIPTAFLCDVTPDCEDGSDESEQVCNAPIKYRLEGGRSSNEGRLEVFYRGEWGTVCDDDFGLKEAQVVCNSFGLYGKPEIAKNIYGPGSGPIWLDQVSCLGNETKIDECNHWSWGENNCNHTEDVGLKCTAGPKPNPAKVNKEPTINTYGKDLEYGVELEQTELDDLGLYQGLWQRSSKAVQSQKKCGHFKTNLVDEYEHPEERVVNGSVAKRGRHPWQATIRTRGRGGISSHWCGAVIISKRLILTAAHCLAGYPKGSYFVRMGDHYANIAESSEIDSNIENWYIHEKFRDQKHMNNDIALILLKTPVRFNDYVQPICLPEKGATLEPNRLCTISGWGSIKSGTSTPSNILRSAQVPILADEVCSQKNVYANAMTEGMFCAGFLDESADACDGDSGGPLVCSDEDGETLYGIISWGQHCGYVNHPGVYVRVEKYIDWIYDKINLMMQQGKL